MKPSQVVYFRNPSERTSTKEHLIRHCHKHKIQVHIPKRNSNKSKIVRISKAKTTRNQRKDHSPKQKLEEQMKIDGYSKHTHSLTHIHRHTLAHPPGNRGKDGQIQVKEAENLGIRNTGQAVRGVHAALIAGSPFCEGVRFVPFAKPTRTLETCMPSLDQSLPVSPQPVRKIIPFYYSKRSEFRTRKERLSQRNDH